VKLDACPYCGYDLTGTEPVGPVRMCPECGGQSKPALIATPWWLLRPWSLFGAGMVIGAAWGAVGLATIALARGSINQVLSFQATAIVLAEITAILLVWRLVAKFERQFGKHLIERRHIVGLTIPVTLAVPIGYVLLLVAIGLVILLFA
jgi:hypothetical protein